MIAIGFWLFASPTARAALGCPMVRATSPYELVSAYGMSSSARHTACWNSVPSGSSGRVNFLSMPEK